MGNEKILKAKSACRSPLIFTIDLMISSQLLFMKPRYDHTIRWLQYTSNCNFAQWKLRVKVFSTCILASPQGAISDSIPPCQGRLCCACCQLEVRACVLCSWKHHHTKESKPQSWVGWGMRHSKMQPEATQVNRPQELKGDFCSCSPVHLFLINKWRKNDFMCYGSFNLLDEILLPGTQSFSIFGSGRIGYLKKSSGRVGYRDPVRAWVCVLVTKVFLDHNVVHCC